jgi:uncharacterized protein YbbC (DUF1343 family)
VGRGTDTPFEVIGAPYIDDVSLARSLNALHQPGVAFVPIRFTPKASIHKEQACRGVNIIVTHRHKIRPVVLGIEIAQKLHQMYPNKFPLDKVNRLLRHSPTLEAIDQGFPFPKIEALWQEDLNRFMHRRSKFLLYK